MPIAKASKLVSSYNPNNDRSEEFGDFVSASPIPEGISGDLAEQITNIFNAFSNDAIKMGRSPYLDELTKSNLQSVRQMILQEKEKALENLRLKIAEPVIQTGRKKQAYQAVKDRLQHYFIPRALSGTEKEMHDKAFKAAEQEEFLIESKKIHQIYDGLYASAESAFIDAQKQLKQGNTIINVDLFHPQKQETPETLNIIKEDLQGIFESFAKASDQASQAFSDNLYTKIGQADIDPKTYRDKIDQAFYDSKRESNHLLAVIQGIYAAEINNKIESLKVFIGPTEDQKEKFHSLKVGQENTELTIKQLNTLYEEEKNADNKLRINETIKKAKLELEDLKKELTSPEMLACAKHEEMIRSLGKEKMSQLAKEAQVLVSKAEDMRDYIKQNGQEKLDFQVFAYDETYKDITDKDLVKNGLFYKMAEKISTLGTYAVKVFEPTGFVSSKIAAHSAVTHGLHAGAAVGGKILTAAWAGMIGAGIYHVSAAKSTALALEDNIQSSEPLLDTHNKRQELGEMLRFGFENLDLAKERLSREEVLKLGVEELKVGAKAHYSGRTGNIVIGSGFRGLFNKIGRGAQAGLDAAGNRVGKFIPNKALSTASELSRGTKERVTTGLNLDKETKVFRTPILEEKQAIASKLLGGKFTRRYQDLQSTEDTKKQR